MLPVISGHALAGPVMQLMSSHCDAPREIRCAMSVGCSQLLRHLIVTNGTALVSETPPHKGNFVDTGAYMHPLSPYNRLAAFQIELLVFSRLYPNTLIS